MSHIWVKHLKPSSPEPLKLWGWILVYSISIRDSLTFVQMMILEWPMTFLQHSQTCVLVVVALLKECCMVSAKMQWLFYSGEWIVAHQRLVFFHFTNYWSLYSMLWSDCIVYRAIWAFMIHKCSALFLEAAHIYLYHFMGKLSRWQIDDVCSIGLETICMKCQNQFFLVFVFFCCCFCGFFFFFFFFFCCFFFWKNKKKLFQYAVCWKFYPEYVSTWL